MMDDLERLVFDPAHFVQTGFLGVGVPYFLGALPYLVIQNGVHTGRVAGALGFGHRRLGHHTVLFHQGGKHVPLAAV